MPERAQTRIVEARSSQEQFDRQATLYAKSTVHRSGPSLPVLIEYADPKPGERALDVATGTGNAAFAIAERGAAVVGVDVSKGMLEQARRRAQEEGRDVLFQEGAAEALPFPAGSFDLVVARHAPHHFRDVARFLAEVRRVLRPGGRFVMADGISPNAAIHDGFNHWQRLRDPSHFDARTVAGWRRLADSAGFRWTQDTIVPYRLEFGWWTRQAGCSPEMIATLTREAQFAPAAFREAIGLEMDAEDRPIAFHDPMLVVRMERP